MPGNIPFTPDGDPAFFKVDTRRPAHELEPGVAADALNKRFEDGRAWPRYGVAYQAWGSPGPNLLAGRSYATAHVPDWSLNVIPVTIGHVYYIVGGNQTQVTDARHFDRPGFLTPVVPAGNVISPGFHVATTSELDFWISPVNNIPVTAQVYEVQNPQAFHRFSDPNGVDTLVLATDQIRDQAGDDGGRGRAWRIASGNNPQVVPLNGHDVWGAARLIPCLNGLVMLRQGDERHYFSAAAVDLTNSRIKLNCVPNWNTGDLVEYVTDDGFSYITGPSGATPPQSLTDYFVKNVTGSVTGQVVELYSDPGLSTKLAWAGGSAHGRFYLQRAATNPGPYGNAAPPLIMQPGAAGVTAFEAGFKAVPVNVAATAFDATSLILTAGNHRLIPGDQIKYLHTNAAIETFNVAVLSPDTLRLFTTSDDALANLLASAQTPSPGFAAGDVIYKSGASKLAMPGGREGVYLPSGRLLIANGNSNVPISDPLDPLHFAPVSQTINANLGESDAITCFEPLGDDVVGKDITIIGKQNVILRIMNLSGAANTWSLKEVTREYGFIAPLATIRAGSDVWGLSRRGMVSVLATMAAVLANPPLPAPPPVSFDIKKYIDLIDWAFADQAAAESWNNRAFLAVPLKGQTILQANGRPLNNAVLVYNFLNQGWEGIWTGPGLQVYDWARHLVYGEERLCFVNYQGAVCWLSEGWTDTQLDGTYIPIADSLTTRIYCKGNQDPKLWLKGLVVWDQQNCSMSVSAQAPGWNEVQQLLAVTYDNTKYTTYGTPDYSPTGGNFNAPDRQDYSLQAQELLQVNAALDVHQNLTETLRLRVQDWGVQFVIANTQGSCRLQSIAAEFVPGLKTFSRKT